VIEAIGGRRNRLIDALLQGRQRLSLLGDFSESSIIHNTDEPKSSVCVT
jgi:hypothetical protein